MSVVRHLLRIPDVLIFMLLGVALYQNGFLTGQQSTSVYVKTAVIGYLISLPLAMVAAVESWRSGFEVVRSNAWLTGPYDICRVSGALANAALVLLILRAGALKWVTVRVAAVGQTALSNYLLTSILCRFCLSGGRRTGTALWSTTGCTGSSRACGH